MGISATISRCFCCTRATPVIEIQHSPREFTIASGRAGRTPSQLNKVPIPEFPPQHQAGNLDLIEGLGAGDRNWVQIGGAPIGNRRPPGISDNSNSQFLAERELSQCFEADSQMVPRSFKFQNSLLINEASVRQTIVSSELASVKSEKKEAIRTTRPFPFLSAAKNFTMADSTGICGLSRWAIAKNKRDEDVLEVRPFMEDLEIIFKEKEFHAQLFAVCDGSNGITAVEYVEESLAVNLQITLQKMISKFGGEIGISDAIVYDSLLSTFTNTDNFLKENALDQYPGTGISGILAIQGKLWPFNRGDSKILLSNKGLSYQLSYPAKEKDQKHDSTLFEKEALPGLIIDQAIALRAKPTIYEPIPLPTLRSDHFIVIASKGIHSVRDPHRLLEEIHAHNKGYLAGKARTIVDAVSAAGAKESCTAMVIQLNSEK